MINKKDKKKLNSIDEVFSFLKDKGFIFASSKIYGGVSNSWDIGPLGTMLKNNIKNEWIKFFIDSEYNNYLFDSSIFQNNEVWKNSGHEGKFNDKFVECNKCKKRFRIDDLIETLSKRKRSNRSEEELLEKIKCPNCGEINWGSIKDFNLMFKVNSSKSDDGNFLYLRPETSQGIFVNFKNFIKTLNLKIPFGIGQIGKSFRNEITPGNFIFKTKEFEQLEFEKFISPKKEDQLSSINNILKKTINFLEEILRINPSDIKILEVPKSELSHYSKMTMDVEYKFPFGWKEISGIANRGNFDLKSHQLGSGENFEYIDPITKEKYLPNVIELSMGVERLMLSVLFDSYIDDLIRSEDLTLTKTRIFLNFPFNLAPYKLAFCPLTNVLHDKCFDLYKKLLGELGYPIFYTKSGSIGKRYRKMDEIGVPFVIAYDFESEETQTVTIRNRNTMSQDRIKISQIKEYIEKNHGSI